MLAILRDPDSRNQISKADSRTVGTRDVGKAFDFAVQLVPGIWEKHLISHHALSKASKGLRSESAAIRYLSTGHRIARA
eukprot:3729703-Rhodomonas_salina.1